MATFAGVAEGIKHSDVLGTPAGELVGHMRGVTLAGAIFGLLPWSVLRRFVPVSRWTILGTVVGLLLGSIVGYEVDGPLVAASRPGSS